MLFFAFGIPGPERTSEYHFYRVLPAGNALTPVATSSARFQPPVESAQLLLRLLDAWPDLDRSPWVATLVSKVEQGRRLLVIVSDQDKQIFKDRPCGLLKLVRGSDDSTMCAFVPRKVNFLVLCELLCAALPWEVLAHRPRFTLNGRELGIESVLVEDGFIIQIQLCWPDSPDGLRRLPTLTQTCLHTRDFHRHSGSVVVGVHWPVVGPAQNYNTDWLRVPQNHWLQAALEGRILNNAQ